MPLNVIDQRLKDYRIFCHGERPKTMLPQRREHYTHIMIEVTDDDPEPRPIGFPVQASIRLLDFARGMLASCLSRRKGKATTVTIAAFVSA